MRVGEHVSHTIMPQQRQWCLRRSSRWNSALQIAHSATSASRCAYHVAAGYHGGCTAGTSTREAALPRAYTIRKCSMRSCPSIGPTSLPVCTRAAEHCGIACGISDGGSCLPVRPGREPRLLLLNQVCEYRSIGRRANRSIRSLNERSRHCQSCATRNALLTRTNARRTASAVQCHAECARIRNAGRKWRMSTAGTHSAAAEAAGLAAHCSTHCGRTEDGSRGSKSRRKLSLA